MEMRQRTHTYECMSLTGNQQALCPAEGAGSTSDDMGGG